MGGLKNKQFISNLPTNAIIFQKTSSNWEKKVFKFYSGTLKQKFLFAFCIIAMADKVYAMKCKMDMKNVTLLL